MAILVACTGALHAQEPPQHLHDRALHNPALQGGDLFLDVRALQPEAAADARGRLEALGAPNAGAFLDQRSGRFATLLLSEPMIPGLGVGNQLAWEKANVPTDERAIGRAAWNAVQRYLRTHEATLRINSAELQETPHITVHDGGDLVHMHVQRMIDGIPVQDSYLKATVRHGNLILLGAHKWGDHGADAGNFFITQDVAEQAAANHLGEDGHEWGKTTRVFLPLYFDSAPGRGYQYRAAWSVKRTIDGANNYELFVDAKSGGLLASENRTAYAEVKGGVLPVSNDGIVPDGVEQPGWPMPFADVTGGISGTTGTGGNVVGSGSFTTDFFGPYVNINDNCGSSSLSGSDVIDWGTSTGTDCATPGFGGAGNTHASRTGFYELNKIIEMGRGQLPSNSWLQARLTSNMNINNTCNAFWNGTVNFYRSGGGCFNTGEIAGVFDHEWGHGMDANDATPGIASPSGEGIADIYTALRLNDSCIGRNFRATVCTGFGDPCDTCTGVRDIDYLKRNSNQPHDYTWSNANCSGSVHCVGAVYAEAVWSLWKRELPSLYGYDNNTAHEIVNRLTYIGAGNTGTWFSGGPPNGGCAGSSGYMNYLAADDDNGNLNDGTPHMQAIFNAFNDQEIACGTPTVQDSGCAGTPTTAPIVTTGNGNQSVNLSWNTVSGASRYGVYRTEGVFACDFGKVKLGETTGTSWNDTNLQNGRDYSYVVIPMGSSASCFGPASACATEAPVGQPDFLVSCTPTSQNIEQGTNGNATCTVVSSFGYTGSVALSCSGNPAGIGCAFAPSSVSPPANGSANSTLTLSVSGSQTVSNFTFDVVANDGTDTRTSTISVQVTPAGQNGPQNASYNGGLGAPECSTVGSSCDSQGLLDGRGTKGPEPNQPNTLDTCTDGASGTYHSDESNDRIVVRTLDLFDMVEGATVEVEATVWAWSTGTSDTADFYYAADANNPVWTYIGSVVPPGGGQQVLTQQYTLPAGSQQAVRVNFRYQGSANSCTTGAYDDADDLVFAVAAPGGGCTVDAECDNGLYCDGAETCNAGTCQAGTAPSCDDGVSCTDDSCNEGTDSCDNNANNANCDNGLYCDGGETCDAVNDCQAGSPPVCTFGCDEGGDTCFECSVDADCDDGLFCNGTETCNAGSCGAGSDPCPGQSCDEVGDICTSGATVRAEWGTVSVGSTATTVSLANTFTSPVVVTAVQYDNNSIPVVTRISNVTGSSFDVRLQAAAAGTPVADRVSYLVVEEGAWNVGGVSFEAFTYNSTVTDENNSWVGETQSYQQSYTSPVVLGQVMSSNDADWSVFWTQGNTRTTPPSSTVLRTGKTVCEDTTTARANETVGVVVFEGGHGNLGGIEFEAALGADSIRGVTNSPPYAYTFNTAFAGTPTVGLVTMAGVDGNNGGWAQTHGATMATSTTLNLSIDEDQIGDNERNHTTEQVGYVVFAGAGSVSQ